MVHFLSTCEELSENQILQICLVLNAYKCIRDSETLTYYFYVEKIDAQ